MSKHDLAQLAAASRQLFGVLADINRADLVVRELNRANLGQRLATATRSLSDALEGLDQAAPTVTAPPLMPPPIAYQMGQHAARAGQRLRTNPHSVNVPEGRQWVEGWFAELSQESPGHADDLREALRDGHRQPLNARNRYAPTLPDFFTAWEIGHAWRGQELPFLG